MTNPAESGPSESHEGWWTRDHALILVLVVATTLLLYLCGRLIQPFFNPIAWALALAVVASPFHGWIARRMEHPSLAAGFATLAVALIIVVPVVLVSTSLIRECGTAIKAFQAGLENGTWQEQLAQQYPRVAGVFQSLDQQIGLGSQFQTFASETGKSIAGLVTGSAWASIELVLTFFVLFYLFRDRRAALRVLRSLVPLSDPETDKVFHRISDTIHASIFGTLVVAAVQGTLGGLMFWWLGLPSPVFWGAAMALLAIVPVLGTFVVWVPAAIYLAASGHWGKAAILAAWGGLVIATIDNLLYPILVGKSLRLHTVPVFFAIVGGLAVFGACGLILGPVVLALTDAVLQIWRARTAGGQPAEAATVSDH